MDQLSAEKPTTVAPATTPTTPEKTRGDKMFDRLVYGLLNGVGTFIVTLPLAYWATYGRGAAKFARAGEALTEHLRIPEKTAVTVMRVTALGLGGTAMVAPVRLAEAYRESIVGYFNGEKNRPASPEQAPSEPSAPPPQTWGSLLRGRVVAWSVVFASFIGFGAASKAAGHPQALANFENMTGKMAVEKFGRAGDFKRNIKTAHYGKLAAQDVFATAAAATLLYAGSRFFAKHRTPEAEARIEAARQANALLDATPDTRPAPEQPATTIGGEKQLQGPLHSPALEPVR